MKPLIKGVVAGPEVDCNQTESWDWIQTIQPAYLSLICVLGVGGNILVVMIFCLQRRSSVADIYLGNLALADLLMVSCLPFWVVTIHRNMYWTFGELLCKLVNLVIEMNYYCSVLFLTLVSVDRYLVLTQPLAQSRLRGRFWVRGVCLGVWVVGALLSLPALLFRTVNVLPDVDVTQCYMAYPNKNWRLSSTLIFHLLGFIIPVPVVSFCCFHILRVLKESQEMRRSRRSGEEGEAERKAERKAAHLVLIVLGVFVFCWLPHQVVKMLDTLYDFEMISGCIWGHALKISAHLSTCLGYSNSALNPFLYVIVGKHFRQRVKAVFGGWRRRSRQTSSSTTI